MYNVNPKYIVNNKNEIVIFPATQNHSKYNNQNPISAGFINFGHPSKKPKCYGESISLNLKSRTEDTEILNDMLNINI